MPVTSIATDPEALTMTAVAEYAVPLRRLWDAYVDPRQVEQFWTVASHPCRFLRHDGFAGGRSLYRLTGPEGSSHTGYWEWIEATAPAGERASIEMRDGLATEDGTPIAGMPSVRMIFDLEATPGGSRLTSTSYLDSPEMLEQFAAMGIVDSTAESMGRIDDVLADGPSFAHGRSAHVDVLTDTRVRVSRVVRGAEDKVWEAHHDADLMRRWMTGPDGWTLPVCEVAAEVGDGFRYEWEADDGGEARYRAVGQLIESRPPHRDVATETSDGAAGSSILKERTFTPVASGTLAVIVVTYPDADARDTALTSGMVDGIEANFRRLEALLA